MTSVLMAAYRNELRLLRYRKKTVMFLIFSAFLPLLFAFSFHEIQNYIGFIGVTSSYPIMLLSFYTLLWIPLFIFLSLADQFPGEVAARTLKLSLLRPVTRLQAFTAKLLAVCTAIGVLLALLFIVSMACNPFLSSAGGISASEALGYAKAFLAGWVTMIAFTMLFAFAAQFFHSSTGFLAFTILFYAAAKALPFFLPAFSAFSLTAYTDWYVLWLSNSVAWSKLATSTLFLLSGIVLFFSIGYVAFERREA